MVQIIKGPESQSTIRQRALNESLSGAIGAWDQMERTQKQDALTARQEALSLMKTTQDLRKEGYDVNEGQVKEYLAGDKPKSFGDRFKEVFTGEVAPTVAKPDLYGKRTTEWTQKQADAKAEKEFNNKVKNVELETKEYSLKELKDMSPAKKRKMELENQKAQNDTSLFDLNRQKLMADVAKTQADTYKASLEAKVGPKPAQNEFAAAGFAKRARQAESALAQPGVNTGTDWADTIQGASLGIPFVGDLSIPNRAKSESRQLFEQAQNNFVSAVLRKESGAAISPQEAAQEAKKYFPQPGDGPAVVEQKRQAREQAIANLEAEGGNAIGRIKTVSPTGFDESKAARLAELREKAGRS